MDKNVSTKWCVKIRRSVIATITELFSDTSELAKRTKSYGKHKNKFFVNNISFDWDSMVHYILECTDLPRLDCQMGNEPDWMHDIK